MNKHIKELINEATTRERVVGFNPYTFEPELKEPPMYGDVFNKEKFAELIVKECVSLFDGSHEMKTVGLLSHQQVIQQIKEHFGIR